MVNIKKIKARFNQVIATMDRYSDDDLSSEIIIDYSKVRNPIKEFQRVVAVGPMVRDINVGDLVMINPTRYTKVKHEEGSLKNGVIGDNMVIAYNFPTVEIDGEQYLKLSDQDIDFIIEEFEEIKEEPKNIYIPPKKDIIV